MAISMPNLLTLLSTRSLVSLIGCFLLTHTLATAVYRLYFHPLSKYPGPFWARLSQFPALWHTTRGDRHVWLLRLQHRYGNTFRYSPNQILVNTPAAANLLADPRGNIYKANFYRAWAREQASPCSLECVDVVQHIPKRKVLNKAFSDKALRDYEPYIVANVDHFCEMIAEKINAPGRESDNSWSIALNMAHWMDYLTFDIMGDLCLGQSFHLIDPGPNEIRGVLKLIGSMMTTLNQIARSPIAPLWVWLKPRGLDWLFGRIGPLPIRQFWAFVDDCLTERLKTAERERSGGDNSKVRRDFSCYLFDPKATREGFTSYAELQREIELLVVAGSDTTSIVLASIFFYLSCRTDVQNRLASEIKTVFPGRAGDIRASPALLTSCKYLRAVIQEGLRMTPPVPADLPRTVGPGGTVLHGDFFPAGTDLSLSPYCLGHSTDIFPDPFEFRPERWIVGPSSTEESVRLAESGLYAFSSGSRGCAGKNLAWLEMSIIIAKVVDLFEMRRIGNLGGGIPVTGRPGRRNAEEYQVYECFLSTRDGPMVQFRKRGK
ncbi:cytochrome P450 [Xylaria sp. FL0064]|nr:cytochrome P450 [Xylaria sp. FL0064]